MTRVYVAGPMTGLPGFNFNAFDDAAADLRARGFDVVSPSEMDNPSIRAVAIASPDGAFTPLDFGDTTWGDFLSRDVKLIADSGVEALIVLPGWQRSRGARLETFIARALCGLNVYDYSTGYPVPVVELVQAWAGGLWSEVMHNA